MVFWGLFALSTILMMIFTDSDNEYPAIMTFIVSLAIFFGLSQPPTVDWKFFVGYFIVGAAWWFFVFNVRLIKLKNFLTKNPDYVKEGKIQIPYGHKHGRDINYEMTQIHESEPSYEKFFSRTFCWPVNMVKFFFSDFAVKVYEIVSNFAILYKNKLLGLK